MAWKDCSREIDCVVQGDIRASTRGLRAKHFLAPRPNGFPLASCLWIHLQPLRLCWVMWRRLRRTQCHKIRWQYQLEHRSCKSSVVGHITAQVEDDACPESAELKPTSAPNTPSDVDDIVKEHGAEKARVPPTKFNLPLSPLMDPKLIAARERHHTPKPAASQERSAFSQKLQNNPYGRHTLRAYGKE